jgi:hypothetical protein
MNINHTSIDIDRNEPHRVSEVICVKCYSRWLAVRNCKVKLKELYCGKCGQGFVIETGEIIDSL